MRRTWPLHLLLSVLLGGLAGFAWLTHHPEAAWLAEAESWPLAGPLAAAFRARYLPPEGTGGTQPGAPAGGGGREVQVVYLPETAAGELRGAVERIWLPEGTPLRTAPEAAAPIVGRLAAIANVPVIERRDGWARVAYRQLAGWVEAPPEEGPPPLGSDPVPPRPVPALAPDAARLARARALLGDERPGERLGPYPLYTDHADPHLVAFLGRAAEGVEAAYRQRYGREPLGEAAEAVVLFSREAGYRAFQEGEQRLAGLRAAGHAGYGLVALYAGGLGREEVAATLVHELTHLLNRRALGPALPPWLDEGLAGDLASSAFGPAGDLQPDRLGGAVRRAGDRIDFHGARASVRHLADALDAGSLVPLGELLALPWEEFVRPPLSERHYAESAFLVRYLLAGEGGELASGFRAFLAAVSRGEPATAEALARHLGRPWSLTELGFRTWLRFTDQETRQLAGIG